MTQSRLATVAASLDTTIQPFDQLFGRPTCLLRCTSDCGPERDRSDVAVVFATQWTTESIDTALVLPDGQDLLIAAVANANPRTIVVLETGGPVLMPWAPKVPFGHGLSYSTFSASDLVAKVNGLGIDVSLTWKNTGSVWGRDVAQVYAARAGWESNKRLVGYEEVELGPGEQTTIHLKVDPRLLATFRTEVRSWEIAAGDVEVFAGTTSLDRAVSVHVSHPGATLEARAPHSAQP